MPRKTYPRPGHSATGSAFLPGKTPRLSDLVEVAKILCRVLRKRFPGQKFCVGTERYSGGSSIDRFRRVRYGADFIVRKREASPEAHVQLLAWLSEALGEPIEELKLYPVSYLRERDALARESVRDDEWRRSGESLGTRPPLELQTRSER